MIEAFRLLDYVFLYIISYSMLEILPPLNISILRA